MRETPLTDGLIEPRTADSALEAVFSRLYAQTLAGADENEALALLCRRLARLLGMRLVLFGDRHENGIVTVRAASAENPLWADLLRLPERWDGGAAAGGPGAAALRSGRPEVVRVTEDGFMPWRAAAEREHVRIAAAWPLRLDNHAHVLELFSDSVDRFENPAERVRIGHIVERLADVLRDLAQMRRERLLARALECNGSAAFLTDVNGIIVWCNEAFCRLYGHRREDVIGRNPRLLQSGRQGMRYYRNLWSTIRSGKVWTGETVDRDRNGAEYTVRQTISPVSVDGRVTHYLSVQDNISRERETRDRHELRVAVDERTGLLTRSAFEHRLDELLEDPQAHATLLLITMRRFHQALAAHGFEVEDPVLAAIGERIREAVPPPHEAGALGAGEYGVLFQGAVTESEVEAVAGRLRERLAARYAGLDGPASVRTAVAHAPEHGGTFYELHRHADREFADEPLRPARRTLRPA